MIFFGGKLWKHGLSFVASHSAPSVSLIISFDAVPFTGTFIVLFFVEQKPYKKTADWHEIKSQIASISTYRIIHRKS